MRADLFVTCIIDQLFPDVGVSAVRVLRRLGVGGRFPGRADLLRAGGLQLGVYPRGPGTGGTKTLHEFQNSEYVVVPSGSCSAMMRVFYLDLFEDDPAMLAGAEAFAAKVYEFSEFLTKVLEVEDPGVVGSGSAVFHPGCHLLREMEVREAPQALDCGPCRAWKSGTCETPRRAAGSAAAFSVKLPHISEGMLADKVASVRESGADSLVSCDMSCLMHIGGALRRQAPDVRIRHIAQVLDGQPSEL